LIEGNIKYDIDLNKIKIFSYADLKNYKVEFSYGIPLVKLPNLKILVK